MFELTELESQLLNEILNLGMLSLEYWYLEEETSIPINKLRGVVSSLVQKGILEKFKSDGENNVGFVSTEIYNQIKSQLSINK